VYFVTLAVAEKRLNNEFQYKLAKNIVIAENENILFDFLNKRNEFGFTEI